MNNIRFTPARMYSVFGLTLFAFALQNTALQAAAIVPTSSCTINGTAAPCSTFTAGPAEVFLFSPNRVLASEVTFGTLLEVTIVTYVETRDPVLSATASSTLLFYVKGEGPVRPGFAEFGANTDIDGGASCDSCTFGGTAFARIQDLACDGPLCFNGSLPTPIMLGVPILVELRASAFANGPSLPPGAPGAVFISSSGVHLSLFDADFNVVNIVPTAIPEPGTCALMSAAVVLLLLRRRVRT